MTSVASAATATATASENLVQGPHLVQMSGTVGAGKTTCVAQLVSIASKAGYKVHVANFDKAFAEAKGNSVMARETMTELVQKVVDTADEQTILIMDTCGEAFNKDDIFGVALPENWTVHVFRPYYTPERVTGYMAWSLHNVLSRPATHQGLHPKQGPDAVMTCIKVHALKAKTLKGAFSPIWEKSITLTAALSKIRDKATEFARYIKSAQVETDNWFKSNLLTDE